jgi:ribonuclease Z
MGPLRQGRKFSFMTDTGYVPGAVDFVRGSDLLICEGMFAEELAADAQEKKHLTARQAAHIASMAEVKRLGLIHYSPRYTDRELKGLLAEAREIFPEAFLTRELQAIELLYPDWTRCSPICHPNLPPFVSRRLLITFVAMIEVTNAGGATGPWRR